MENIQVTYREAEILRQISDGKSNLEIGQALDIEENTVKSHIQSIFKKMQVENRTEAVMMAIRLGIITIKAG
jgi:DNA-binding NarL/FixJ family response regulator